MWSSSSRQGSEDCRVEEVLILIEFACDTVGGV